MRIEGLLPNSRMIQGVFDDLNPETRHHWAYPDGPWDPERNTDGFVAAMARWRAHGLLGFTVGLQGGSPLGYGGSIPCTNTAFTETGELRGAYMDRLARILDEADRLGMVVILSLFYFGQDQHLLNEAAVRRAVENTVDWLCARDSRHVLIEIANETDHSHYSHEIFHPDRIHELIKLAQARSLSKIPNKARRLLCGVSMCGGVMPSSSMVAASDLVLLHGNGVQDPGRISEMVRQVRAMDAYRGQPIVFNEDDHFDFESKWNNFIAATREHASWGYFDYRMNGERSFCEGYQSVPCDWEISSERKRGFFRLLRAVTGVGEEETEA